MQLSDFFHALLLIAIFLAVGALIKRTLFNKFIVPSSLIAGLLALALGPQVTGEALNFSVNNMPIWINDKVTSIWKELPSYLIVVVFAGIFLGKKIPSVKESISKSMPNLGFGYTIAIGQYVVGMIVALLVLKPLFATNEVAGALIAVGFQGGHGTVAGLKTTFENIDFAQGLELGLGIATIGLISAIILGTVMSNRTNDCTAEPEVGNSDHCVKIKDKSFGMQFALLGAVIGLAWLLLMGLQSAETWLFPDADLAIFKYMPLFPVAMMVGLVVQLVLNAFDFDDLSSQYHINLLSNLALDMLIVAALGSLNLSVLAKYWQAILILGSVGVVYSASVYFFAGSWYFKKDWKIRGVGELGQSMGTTAVGLLMLKQSTSKPKKHIQPFSYKQPLYEPIVGGGIVTALAIPLIANLGATAFTAVMLGILLAIITGFYFIRKKGLADH